MQVVKDEKPILSGVAKTLSVLVVEDNEINMLLTKKIIESLRPDVRITGAIDGIRALEYFRSSKSNLILMDIQMPGMNGYECAAAIRADENGKSRVPIVALTAGAMQGELERCQQAGMDAYLSKPIRRAEFEQVLNKWLK